MRGQSSDVEKKGGRGLEGIPRKAVRFVSQEMHEDSELDSQGWRAGPSKDDALLRRQESGCSAGAEVRVGRTPLLPRGELGDSPETVPRRLQGRADKKDGHQNPGSARSNPRTLAYR